MLDFIGVLGIYRKGFWGVTANPLPPISPASCRSTPFFSKAHLFKPIFACHFYKKLIITSRGILRIISKGERLSGLETSVDAWQLFFCLNVKFTYSEI